MVQDADSSVTFCANGSDAGCWRISRGAGDEQTSPFAEGTRAHEPGRSEHESRKHGNLTSIYWEKAFGVRTL